MEPENDEANLLMGRGRPNRRHCPLESVRTDLSFKRLQFGWRR